MGEWECDSKALMAFKESSKVLFKYTLITIFLKQKTNGQMDKCTTFVLAGVGFSFKCKINVWIFH